MGISESLLDFLFALPGWFKVGFISMLPIIELRGGIPIGLTLLEMGPVETYIAAVVGNLLPIPFILLLLGPVERLFRKWQWGDRFMTRLFDHTRKRVSAKIEVYEEIGLTLFVAIPLPVTGAWTGALAAYLFGIPLRKSLPCIAAGVLIAGFVVTVVVMAGKGAYLLLSHS
ncbi:MAG: ligand-binding protein SH3 [Thermoplasmata archaeon HGW-Thermoplasmata-1]|nr:MAG: ligand-binding protein SH3 [Thermoplasmata archaeon HGW-Thermoplasmata-1]